MESVQNLTPGAEVVCPKCGKPGVVAIDVFRVKGKEYAYLVVRHREKGSVRRCVIRRADAAQPVGGAKPVAKRERAKPRAAKQARPQAAAAAPTIDVKAVVEEAVKAAVAEALRAVNSEAARIIAEAVSAAVKEALSAVRAELEQQRVTLQRIEDSVRQRKGEGAKAVARGEVKVELRPGTLHWQIVEVLRGRELTKEEIARELERRFNRRVSGNSLSGRLSELRGAGYVECRRTGRVWLWRLARELPAGSAEKVVRREPAEERGREPARSQAQPAPAYVAPVRNYYADIPAASPQPAGLPSFAQGNPWLDILAGRGEVNSAATASSATNSTVSNDLPSFVQDNPWLEVLSGRGASSGNKAESESAVSGSLPSFVTDNPWLAILARR